MYKQIISIHGVPRSGTSWLGQVFNSSPDTLYKFQPLFSYAFKNAIHVRSTREEIIDYYNRLYNFEDEFLDQTKQIERGIYPKFSKLKQDPEFLVTKMVRYHYMIPRLLEELDNIKIIAIVRNPLAVIVSWKSAPKEFPPELDFEQEWRYAENRNLFKPEEYFGFEKWKEATKLFLWAQKTYPNKVFVIKYEDFVQDTEKITKEMFLFCNLRFDTQTKEFIDASKKIQNEDPYSVYKKDIQLDKWKSILPAKVIQEVYNELVNTEFESFIK